jgi:endonuclease YncB( thermonuclease family)
MKLQVRALILPAAALAFAGALVLVAGRVVEGPVTIDPVAPDAVVAAEGATASAPVATSPAAAPPSKEPATPVEKPSAPVEAPQASDAAAALSAPVKPQMAVADPQPSPPKPLAPSRLVAPTIVAPPDLTAEELQRAAPREPLSKLSLALPPMPELKNKWAGTPFFRPLAIESAVFESMGRTIAVAGAESVPLDESCIYEGVSWPCGVRARAAFRMWLRGRALVCQLPDGDQSGEQAVTPARCRLAKQDAGAWLVSNGWARAAPDGPYVLAEEKARAEKMGIFGAPPDTSSISDVPDAPVSATAESEPIMTEEGVDPQPSLGPQLAFPPAPPAP